VERLSEFPTQGFQVLLHLLPLDALALIETPVNEGQGDNVIDGVGDDYSGLRVADRFGR
jgi:hypothetical protein